MNNLSLTIVGTVPTFRCTECVEKRKGFYSKLEEIASEINVLYLKGYQSFCNGLQDMNGNGSLHHSQTAEGIRNGNSRQG